MQRNKRLFAAVTITLCIACVAPSTDTLGATGDELDGDGTEYSPVITYKTFRRCQAANRCRDYHITKVKLRRPEIRLQGRAFATYTETTTSFAHSVGAYVATNGDWSDHTIGPHIPRGLTITDGVQWPNTQERADHGFIACTRDKECEFDPFGSLAPIDPSWWTVVGTNGAPLIRNGVKQFTDDLFHIPVYSSDAQRTAVGLTEDGGTMIMLMAEGRRKSDYGPTWRDVTEVLAEEGAYNADMLDGGGSSAMVVAGRRVNQLGSESERRVRNHLGVVFNERAVTGVAATPSGNGYWIATADGHVEARGDAQSHGSLRLMGIAPTQPMTGIAATPSGNGYWLVAKDGGIFSFGDAAYRGSMGGTSLDAPVVGMAATPSGNGYWLVAADGGIFSFGDATFSGSMGGQILNAPVVGMAATPSGNGYWLVASDGGVFAFGDALFLGSMGSVALNAPVVGIARHASGVGYWLLGADGGVFTFGQAHFAGSFVGLSVAPSVGIIASASGYSAVSGYGELFLRP